MVRFRSKSGAPTMGDARSWAGERELEVRDEPIVLRGAEEVGVGGNAVAGKTVLETEMRVVHGRPCPSLTVWQD